MKLGDKKEGKDVRDVPPRALDGLSQTNVSGAPCVVVGGFTVARKSSSHCDGMSLVSAKCCKCLYSV